MTDEPLEWWKDGPRFSAAGRGPRLAQVPPGYEPTNRIADLVRDPFLGAIVGIGLAVWGALELWRVAVAGQNAAGWWFLALVGPAAVYGVAAACVLPILAAERFARPGIGGPLGGAGALLGVAAGLGAAVVVTRALGRPPVLTPLELTPGETGWLAAAFAAAGAALLARVPFALRTARREAERILRLRTQGARGTATVLELPDPKPWVGHGPVPLLVDDGDATFRVELVLTASPTRIPVVGTRLVAFSSAPRGTRPSPEDLLVEPDPSAPVRFTPHSHLYEQGDSGGGSM